MSKEILNQIMNSSKLREKEKVEMIINNSSSIRPYTDWSP